jgi:PHD/YefM family antitoxin component YafN of YafNO toxin-antitoxin module
MKVTALELRNRLGAILEQLDRDQEPIIIEKGRKPRAALLPLALYQKRFVDFKEKGLRHALVREIRESAPRAASNTLAELRRLRSGVTGEGIAAGLTEGDPGHRRRSGIRRGSR